MKQFTGKMVSWLTGHVMYCSILAASKHDAYVEFSSTFPTFTTVEVKLGGIQS